MTPGWFRKTSTGHAGCGSLTTSLMPTAVFRVSSLQILCAALDEQDPACTSRSRAFNIATRKRQLILRDARNVTWPLLFVHIYSLIRLANYLFVEFGFQLVCRVGISRKLARR